MPSWRLLLMLPQGFRPAPVQFHHICVHPGPYTSPQELVRQVLERVACDLLDRLEPKECIVLDKLPMLVICSSARLVDHTPTQPVTLACNVCTCVLRSRRSKTAAQSVMQLAVVPPDNLCRGSKVKAISARGKIGHVQRTQICMYDVSVLRVGCGLRCAQVRGYAPLITA
jgi:hypothetical protein